MSALAVAAASDLATHGASATSLSASYRCDRLLSLETFKTTTGLRALASQTNGAHGGPKVTCVFTVLPKYPLPFKWPDLKIVVSALGSDSARLNHELAGRLAPLPKLGRHALITVSQTGVIRVVAIGSGFSLDLRSGNPRLNLFRTTRIAESVYAVLVR
jgi:hypothetical protein